MTFSSFYFLFIFIPLFFLVYYLVPKRAKNAVLLTGSIIFYGYTKWWYVPIVLANMLICYCFGKAIEKCKKESLSQKLLVEMAIVIQIIILISLRLEGAWPVGFSFLTFQMISYFIDVAHSRCKAENSLLKFATYSCMFPKLMQGPITRYGELQPALESGPAPVREEAEAGFKLFVLGLGYKVLLADRLAILWNDVRTIGFESISTPLAWIAMFGYSLQLFLDFQGYSLMAIGLGKMLGFNLPMNFDSPYMSRSISDFYRRWHSTLGRWFKDYVYIPLGGSYKSRIRTIVNLFIVWILTGLWHGFEIHFLIWGVFLFFFIMMEKNVWGKLLNTKNIVSKVFSHLYLLFLIPISWMIFAISDLKELYIYFSRLFGFKQTFESACINPDDFIKYAEIYWPFFAVGILCATPIVERFITGKHKRIAVIILLIVFWACVHFIMKSAQNPFMYFSF